MRYGLVAAGALLLLLALLLALAPGGTEGRRASAKTRAAGTGPDSSAPALAAHERAALRGWVQDARGLPVAARVLAFEAGPALTREGLEQHVAAQALEAPARATVTTGSLKQVRRGR
ncbi:hypothetical protein, partial [Cystobacter fuscus]|uniref:hypothetical protein n=1 Tax=Cystobacter fuscus TaxID=43 RepID=UPI0005BD4E2B